MIISAFRLALDRKVKELRKLEYFCSTITFLKGFDKASEDQKREMLHFTSKKRLLTYMLVEQLLPYDIYPIKQLLVLCKERDLKGFTRSPKNIIIQELEKDDKEKRSARNSEKDTVI